MDENADSMNTQEQIYYDCVRTMGDFKSLVKCHLAAKKDMDSFAAPLQKAMQ